jgi:hypothetical protein
MTMKKLTTILALAALSAIASASSSIENIRENCQIVMLKSKNCRVAADSRNYPSGGTTLVSPFGRISNDEISEFIATGYSLGPDGKFSMCALAEKKCLQGMDTQGCKYARAQWRSTPPILASVWERVYAWVSSLSSGT